MSLTQLDFYPKWILFLGLFIATIVTQLANIYYQSIQEQSDFVSKLLPSLTFLSILTIPSILVGLQFGKWVNVSLYKPADSHSNRLNNPILFPIFSGIILGALLLVIRYFSSPYLPDEVPEYGFRGVIGGLLVSIGAAVGEEVWFRYGLMTLVLWGIKKVFNKSELTDRLVWIVIVVVGVAFGAAHLPQLISYGGGTSFALWGTMLGNIAVSMLYGWCFWKHGLVSAIIAHFTLDIVLHVLPAMV